MNLNHTITQLHHAVDASGCQPEEAQELRARLEQAKDTLASGGFSEADELLHVVAQRINYLIELS